MSENKAQKDETKVISYSVCIWEPDYPPIPNAKRGQNKIVVTVIPSTAKRRADDLDLSLREVQMGDLQNILPNDAELVKQTKTDKETGTVKIRFKRTSPTLVYYIQKNTEYCIKSYVSKADSFGCCSSFIE